MSDGEKFHYPLPEDGAPSRWDGLSQPAREALGATAVGPAPAASLLPNLETEAQNGFQMTPEITAWAEEGLGSALKTWGRYSPLFEAPESVDALAATHARYEEVVTGLFRAREDLRASGVKDLGGMNSIADDMSLVLVPWQEFRDQLDQFVPAMNIFRQKQAQFRGYNMGDNHIDHKLKHIISNDQPLYRARDLAAPLLKSSEYLDMRIMNDGDWGIMLAQTEYPDVSNNFGEETPDTLTTSGQQHYSIAGHDVDAMGIFEWFSVTLQEVPYEVQSESMLLANRTSQSEVPRGSFKQSPDRVFRTYLKPGDADNGLPRLAVMALP